MFEVLRAYFENKFTLSDEQFIFMTRQFLQKKLNKGDFLFREGEQARYGVFISSGCLRKYMIDAKGREHIIQFLPETWWVSDMDSMRNGIPTAYFVDAIEDSHLLMLDYAGNQRIMDHIPGFADAFLKGIQKHNAAKDKRIATSLSASAEEKYNEFLATYPSIVQRVPQHMLASYLGLAPETLSRVRKRQSQKKQ